MRILIIDDDQEYVDELESLLVKCGYRPVERAANVAQGLERAEAFKPDVVILDLMLPEDAENHVGSRFPEADEEAAGIRLARKLKDNGFNLRQVVGITTLSAPQDLAPLRELGVETILCKPVPFVEILDALKCAIASGRPAK